MQANRSADTLPELRLRRALHARSLRFRKGLRLVLPEASLRPDIVFTRARVAVFVDGCFWHRCPEHGEEPKANREFWAAKFERNVQRDRRTDAALLAAGWVVVRVWEHEEVEVAADRVAVQVRAALAARAGGL
jgi:DNA mismatch endonuclease (patch repair protein)